MKPFPLKSLQTRHADLQLNVDPPRALPASQLLGCALLVLARLLPYLQDGCNRPHGCCKG
jgi:hypothetical protein